MAMCTEDHNQDCAKKEGTGWGDVNKIKIIIQQNPEFKNY